MIKILFVNATDTSIKIQLYYPPLGVAYLIAALREKFGKDKIKCKVIYSDVKKNIIEFKPDIVGISSVTRNYSFAMEHAKTAKRYGG